MTLPLSAFVFFFLAALSLTRAKFPIRRSLLIAMLVWGVVVTALTEIASRFNHLDQTFSVVGWLLVNLAAAILCLIQVRRRKLSRVPVPSLSFSLVVLLGGICAILVCAGITAWLAPPNNYDSLSYHMARVAHWVQNASVADYPTEIFRQLYLNPWAEFAIAQFQVLSGGDAFANLIQWFSFCGTVLVSTLIAAELGADTRGQIFAGVVAATIPMSILQASNTQNDLVAALWLCAFAYWTVRGQTHSGWGEWVGAGASLGLAILTKTTAYLFAFPFGVWFFAAQWQTLRGRVWQPLLVVVTIVLALNMGHYARNMDLQGTPLASENAPSGHTFYLNETFGVREFISNLTKNVALHLQTPIPAFQNFVMQTIFRVHHWLGIALNDPRLTYPDTVFTIPSVSLAEDSGGNFLHLFLFGACLLLAVRSPLLRHAGAMWMYLACLTGGFFLFVFLLKWQPWNSRLHLPLFVMAASALGIILARALPARLGYGLLLVLVLGALPWVFATQARPWFGSASIFLQPRAAQSFANASQYETTYPRVAAILRAQDCKNIGVVLDGDDPEYLLWDLLRQANSNPPRIEHVVVTNDSSKYFTRAPFDTFVPCAIFDPYADSPGLGIRGGEYVRLGGGDAHAIYVKP